MERRSGTPHAQARLVGQSEQVGRVGSSALTEGGPCRDDTSRSRKLKRTVNYARCSWDRAGHCGTQRDHAGRAGSLGAGTTASSTASARCRPCACRGASRATCSWICWMLPLGCVLSQRVRIGRARHARQQAARSVSAASMRLSASGRAPVPRSPDAATTSVRSARRASPPD